MTRSSPAATGPSDPIDLLYARLVRAAESDDFVRSDRFDVLDRRVGDTVAFVRRHGAGRYLPKAGGPVVPFDHNYLDVLVREPAGEWRIAVHQAGPANQNPTAWG